MNCDGTGGWGRLSGDYLFLDMSAEELAVTLYEVVMVPIPSSCSGIPTNHRFGVSPANW
jgi:hypothetical protein